MPNSRDGSSDTADRGHVTGAARKGRLHRSLSLQSKFLLGTAAILLACSLGGAFWIYHHEKRQLEEEAFTKSELVMAAVEASRAYVREELRPVMFTLLGEEHFVLEAMSTSYVGRAVMDRISPAFPNLEYRRASINARNPLYEANRAELTMIEYFRSNPDEAEWKGIVEVDGQPAYKRFTPVRFEQECMRCHGDPAHAPRELIELYGPEGGFGHSPGGLTGIVSIGIPVEAALAQVRERAVSIFVTMFVILFFIFLSLSLLFNRMVVLDLRELLVASQDATGHRGTVSDRDELGLLGISFQTMLEELHASRERMRQWNLALEQEVDRMRKDLEKAQAQLIHNEKMAALGRITANVTHAIRNPLMAAGGFARRLEGVAKGDQESRYARIVRDELQRLERMLKEVLVFSQEISAGGTVDSLHRLVRDILESYEEPFRDQGIEVETSVPPDSPSPAIDGGQLAIALKNLIDNALDAMPLGGRLSIRADTAEREGRLFVELTVADNGPGLAKSIAETLFEPFSTTKDKGSGLGLPICKKIVEEHGGSIEVQSAPDQGASFHLSLPVDQGVSNRSPVDGPG
jgi:signal transduction histidine kinase